MLNNAKEKHYSILVKDGKIFKVGEKNDLLKFTSKDTQMIDLKENTLMPSFNELVKSTSKAQEVYKSFGITTMQEGMIVPLMSDILI
ncbi:Uncharacterised protein [uncultured Clostridium sp.]|nr:Uncharacterised protein [uncultured Clostridium sp.]SCI88882.1 Uncharacterised protein [uncultured Clostridium sp.]